MGMEPVDPSETDRSVAAAHDTRAAGRVDSASDDRTANNGVRHQYRVLSEDEKAAMVAVKDAGAALLSALDQHCKPGRETALARTNAEQAVMWAVKGITG